MTAPEVYRTQTRAIFEAACEVTREGIDVRPEVMIPLVSIDAELAHMRSLVVDTAEEVIAEYGAGPEYLVGTMIELPDGGDSSVRTMLLGATGDGSGVAGAGPCRVRLITSR